MSSADPSRVVSWTATLHYAYASRAWCGLVALLADGRAIVRHEVTFRELTPEFAALTIYRAMRGYGIAEIEALVLQAECFPPTEDYEGGEPIAETFAGCGFDVAAGDDRQVKAGWTRLRVWLTPVRQQTGIVIPSLQIHKDCARLLKSLPTIVSDKKDRDLIVEHPEAFPLHALRRFVMSRPIPIEAPPPPLPADSVGALVEAIRAAAVLH